MKKLGELNRCHSSRCWIITQLSITVEICFAVRINRIKLVAWYFSAWPNAKELNINGFLPEENLTTQLRFWLDQGESWLQPRVILRSGLWSTQVEGQVEVVWFLWAGLAIPIRCFVVSATVMVFALKCALSRWATMLSQPSLLTLVSEY